MVLPKISIITVCYNSASTIEKTIQSVLSQQYINKEFVIIDGKSSDSTLEIISRYQDHIDVLISEKDRGIPEALNKGIKRATGDWLYFLSSDDVFNEDDVLAKLFSNTINSDMIYGNVILKSNNQRYDGEFDLIKILRKNICHQAQFYKRHLFDVIGNYNERYKMLSDYDHTLRIFAHQELIIQYFDITVAVFNDTGRTSYIIDKSFWKDRRKNFIDRFEGRFSKKILSRSYEIYLYYCLKDGSVWNGFFVLIELLYYSKDISYISAAFRNLKYRFRSHA